MPFHPASLGRSRPDHHGLTFDDMVHFEIKGARYFSLSLPKDILVSFLLLFFPLLLTLVSPQGVAVPSRIPSLTASTQAIKPLRGTRFAVKDIFNIQGLRVTAGDMAFYSVSRPAPVTCPAVQRLLDAGAELTGTLRLPIPNDDQMKLIDQFTKDLEQTFGTETKKVSIADAWKAKPATDAGGQSVQDYLADVRIPDGMTFLLILKYLTKIP